MPHARSGQRPKYLNLLAIRLPLPGFVSILHRASGLLLIAALPFLIWALDVASGSAGGYAQVAEVMSHPFIKLLLLSVIWATMHHLCAGIRFLLTEAQIGLELGATRAASWVVLLVSALATVAIAGAVLF